MKYRYLFFLYGFVFLFSTFSGAEEQGYAKGDFALESQLPLTSHGGEVTVLGEVTAPKEFSIEGTYAIARESAEKRLANEIRDRLAILVQTKKQKLDSGEITTAGQRALDGVRTSIKPGEYYSEEISVTTADGDEIPALRLFLTIKISEDELKRSVLDAVSAEDRKDIAAQWNHFIGPIAQTKMITAEPAHEANTEVRVIASEGFTVQLSAFLNKAHAEDFAKKLTSDGLNPLSKTEKTAAKTWYVVSVGQFPTETKARAYKKKLQAQYNSFADALVHKQ